MNVLPFDPYAAQSRWLWLNRLAAWRAHAAESAFSGLAWCAGLAVIGWIALSQLPTLRALVTWLLAQHPWLTLCCVIVALGVDHWRARRTQRQRWADDWLSAQPIGRPIRRRRRLIALATRCAWQSALIAPLLLLANASAMGWLVLGSCALAAASLGNWLGDIDGSPVIRGRRRETLFTSTATGSLRRWQWIEAGASLAPRHLAPLLVAILLVPRGPAAMAIAALVMVLMASAVSAWLRAVRVVIQAERWLAVEPISATTWLRQCLFVPLLGLLVGALALAALMLAVANAAVALVAAVGLLIVGALYIGVVGTHRAQPRRIPLSMTLHVVLLAATVQALAPLLPLVVGAQLFVLFQWGLRR